MLALTCNDFHFFGFVAECCEDCHSNYNRPVYHTHFEWLIVGVCCGFNIDDVLDEKILDQVLQHYVDRNNILTAEEHLNLINVLEEIDD